MFKRLQNWAIVRFVQSVQSNPEVHIEQRKEADARLDLIGRLVVARAGLIGLILVFYFLVLLFSSMNTLQQRVFLVFKLS